MAECVRFVCTHCGREARVWDEGNPYYLDGHGNKQYAYHPDPQRERCIGNDTPTLCLNCGAGFQTDSRAPVSACPECAAADIVPTFSLGGQRCPVCKSGTFERDLSFFVIS